MKHIIKALGLSNAKRDRPSPFLDANPGSKATFWWLNHHLWRGFKRPLSPADIYTVLPEESSQYRVEVFHSEWSKLTAEQKNKKNSLLKTVLKAEWKLFSVSLLLILLGEVCKFIQPFLIAELVTYFKSKDTKAVGKTWGIAASMVILSLIYSVATTKGQYLGQVVAMRMRTSCTAVLSRKVTRMTRKALGEMSTGTIVNLLATDVERFYNAASEFRGLFIGPVVLLALVVLVSVEVQISLLPALVFVTLLMVLRLQVAEWADKRIHLVSEIVYAMKMVKCYCWEKFFLQKAEHLRRNEIKKVGQAVFINGLNLNLGHSCDRIVTFLLVLTFILTGHNVKYKLAVEILTWMKMGQLGFLNFPIGYSMWCQMESSLTRIQQVLVADEISEAKKDSCAEETKAKNNPLVHLKNVGASWATSDKHATKSATALKELMIKSISSWQGLATKKEGFVPSGTFSLRNITLEANAPGLVAVIGPVGSGKSSFLMALLGSLPIVAGKREIKGTVSYVPQNPWIRNTSVRDNILMGQKMDRKRYTNVLTTCALQKDMVNMEHGDQTKLGERGSTLSGGQKSRISLARALYRDADIYLIDDPFSALDSKVAGHIFHSCVRTFLHDKIVVLTTHQLTYLGQQDHLIVLREGKMIASGGIEEIKARAPRDTFIQTLDSSNSVDLGESEYDVLAKQDKVNLVQTLFTPTVERENAHIPKTSRVTPLPVYTAYVKAGYGYVLLMLFSALLLAQQACSIYGEWWLVHSLSGGYEKKGYGYDKGNSSSSYGTNGYGYPTKGSSDNGHDTITQGETTKSNVESFIVQNASTDLQSNFAAVIYASSDQSSKLMPYASAVWSSFLIGLLAVCAGSAFFTLASRNLYNTMFHRLLKAPLFEFSRNKAGEMINRFSRDSGRMDDMIPISINATFLTAAIILTHSIYICLINYYVILATLPFLACIALFVFYCVYAIRDTKRLESEFRTPTFGHMQAVLEGLETIRAFGVQKLIIKEGDTYLDRHTGAWHMYIACQYWMKMRFNWLVTVYLALVLIIALASPHDETMSAPLGLSLAYILVFMNRVQYFATYASMLDANMTSVEHVYEFKHLEQEKDHPKAEKIPRDWPQHPSVTFQCVNLTFKGSNKLVLKDINISVKEREKVVIVGRTGAGKSSILSALMRLEQFTGKVSVGGHDIKRINLELLRERINIIPQEPVMFSGTLRENLDPYDHFTDDEIWEALEKVKMKKRIGNLPGRLNIEIEAECSIFSTGQLQLLCMVRALLNKSKLVALDEPNSSMDCDTDALIHRILFEEFENATVLCTSHRLERTAIYDRVVIIDEGRVIQMGRPYLLLQDKEGSFNQFVKLLGPEKSQEMVQVAEETYRRRQLALLNSGAELAGSDISLGPDVEKLKEITRTAKKSYRGRQLAPSASLLSTGAACEISTGLDAEEVKDRLVKRSSGRRRGSLIGSTCIKLAFTRNSLPSRAIRLDAEEEKDRLVKRSFGRRRRSLIGSIKQDKASETTKTSVVANSDVASDANGADIKKVVPDCNGTSSRNRSKNVAFKQEDLENEPSLENAKPAGEELRVFVNDAFVRDESSI